MKKLILPFLSISLLASASCSLVGCNITKVDDNDTVAKPIKIDDFLKIIINYQKDHNGNNLSPEKYISNVENPIPIQKGPEDDNQKFWNMLLTEYLSIIFVVDVESADKYWKINSHRNISENTYEINYSIKSATLESVKEIYKWKGPDSPLKDYTSIEGDLNCYYIIN